MVSLKDLRISDVMRETKLVAAKDQRLSEVLGTMKKHGIHEMPVVEKGKLIGLIDLDQLIRSRRVPISSEVRSVLNQNPTISPTDTIPRAAKMMLSSDFKAIPVTEKGRFKGMVSRNDIVSRIPELEELKGLTIQDIMTPGPTCVFEGDTVDQARKVMRDLDERSLPVIDKNGNLVGMVDILSIMEVLEKQNLTRRTRARRVVGGKKRPRPIVHDIMTKSVAAIGKKATVRDIVRIMRETGSTNVVITEMDNPVGIVTQWDFLELLASAEEEEGVHIQITGLEHEDASVYDGIYWFVQKFVKKVARSIRPTILHIHGIEHMKDGETVRYTVSIKLVTTRTSFNANREGYDLFGTIDECLAALEKVIKKRVEKKKSRRKGIL